MVNTEIRVIMFCAAKYGEALYQISSIAQPCPTLYDPMNRSTPGLPVHHQLPELAQSHVHRVGDTIQPFHPLSSPAPPTFNLSQDQGLFQWVGPSHQVAKVSFSISPSNEYSGLDWFPLGWTGSPCSPRDSQESSPTAQFKTSILRCSAFFIVQLSHPYITTGKTIALTRRTSVGKVMSLLFKMLSRSDAKYYIGFLSFFLFFF